MGSALLRPLRYINDMSFSVACINHIKVVLPENFTFGFSKIGWYDAEGHGI